MAVWGVVNQKGGVGKTTTAVNVASSLAQLGKRVLLIDCDPQGNATTGFGLEKSSLQATLADVLEEAVESPDSSTVLEQSLHPIGDSLWVIPATLDLAGSEPLLMNAVGKEVILRETLAKIQDRFDWVMLDAPPSLGLLTINVLAASDRVLVPLQCEFYALEGLSQLMKTIEMVRRRINPNLDIAQVLLTMHDGRNRLTQQVADEVVAFFGDKVSSIVIPRNVRLSEAPSFGKPAVELFPDSRGATAYADFVREVMAS
ncbi:MAG TPA: ParA family protein [Fimbriimonadaceae bacterium]|nr:ParA family protein [Fimbriimonadaceae bacterium]HRJ31980.1 ParA family protein [Fimbriimonadaceae bacterium]